MPVIDTEELKGFEFERLQSAILGAFNPDSFAQALRFKLDRRLDQIAGPGAFPKRIFAVVEASQEEGWTNALITGLREANPTNKQLRYVAETFGMIEARREPLPGSKSFERIVREDGGFSDVLLWSAELAAHQRRICRIERPINSAVGTGFLVGPGLMLTNHHVMANAIAKPTEATDVACRFDYAVGPAGTRTGKTYDLAADWLVASSPPHELDYCLVRLAARVDNDKGAQMDSRGWIAITSKGVMPKEHDILLVMQHPDGLPVKVALGAVLGPIDNLTRLRHDANTKRGSSGSPCFNSKLDLVGLHHSGDPFYDAPGKPKYNQAISIGPILRLLSEQGVAKFWSD